MVNNARDAAVVSISLNRSMIRELDALQKSLGFTGRSELVRAGIRALEDAGCRIIPTPADIGATAAAMLR